MRKKQVTHESAGLFLRRNPAQAFFQLVYAELFHGADMEDASIAGRGRRLFVIAFVADDEMGDVLLAKNLHQFFVDRCHAFSGIEDENGDIRLVQDAARPLDSEFAQVARVVKARRVNEEDGAERKKFHRFRYRVGRRTLFGGDDGDFLSRDGIDEAGFPGIAAAEKADVQTFA